MSRNVDLVEPGGGSEPASIYQKLPQPQWARHHFTCCLVGCVTLCVPMYDRDYNGVEVDNNPKSSSSQLRSGCSP